MNKRMSLPVRVQPLQSPNDYLQSQDEQRAFVDMAFDTTRTGLVRWFWNRFGFRQVSNKVTIARKDQPPLLSQFFNYNGMNIIDGGYSVKDKEACCKKCAGSSNDFQPLQDLPPYDVIRYSKPPFTCFNADPQGSETKCGPWHGLPTKLYLYNDFYICCQNDPFGLTAGQLLQKAKAERNSIDHQRLNFNLDPATRTQGAEARRKVGYLMNTTNHYVSTRISTS